VKATTFYDDPDVVAKVSRGLGEPWWESVCLELAPESSVTPTAAGDEPGCRRTCPAGDVAEHLRALVGRGPRRGRAQGGRTDVEAVDRLIIPVASRPRSGKLIATFDLLEPLRKRLSSGLPVFGSCAGMIMLADRLVDMASGQDTLGGLDISVRRNAFGRQVDSFESDIPLRGVAGPAFRAVFIRAPWVEEAAAGVEILGAEPRTGRIVAVRQGPRCDGISSG
jgi:5'-phosphate synthase pdxT subunit